MISKIIPRPLGSNDRAPSSALSTFPRDLTLYVMRADPEALQRLNTIDDPSYIANLHRYARGEEHEEVGLTLTRNLIADDPEKIALELEARLAGAGLSNNYVHHMVLSWRPDEDYQHRIEEAAQIYLDALGYSHCPCVIGEHRDTDNPHIHLVVVPVDVRTGEEVKRYEYDKTRSQMATAVLCDRFGWEPEKEARYSVIAGMLIRDGQDVIGPADRPGVWPDTAPPPRTSMSQRSREYERDTQRPSLERIVRTIVPSLLENCTSLAELDRKLAGLGLSLARYGNGAAFFDRETHVKASLANRWSRRRIEEKFGDLPVWSASKQPSIREKPPLTSNDIRRNQYEDARCSYLLRLNMTNAGFRNAALADRRLASSLCRELSSICSFPSFADWQDGARPYDPVQVYSAHFTASAIRPNLHGTSRDLYRSYAGGSRAVHPGLRLTSSAVRIDLVDSFIFVGKMSAQDIEHAMDALAGRGRRTFVTTGFTAAERRHADRYASASGIKLYHAKTEEEAQAIEHALSRQRSADIPPAGKKPELQNIVLETSRRQPPAHPIRPDGRKETEGAALASGREEDVKGSSSGSLQKQPAGNPSTTFSPDRKAAQMLADWTNAVATRDSQANRLALLVTQDDQASAFAQAMLPPDQLALLRQNAEAQLDFLREAQRRAQEQAGFGL